MLRLSTMTPRMTKGPADAAPLSLYNQPRFAPVTFIAPQTIFEFGGFSTQRLAYMLDSLVRVTRRVKGNHERQHPVPKEVIRITPAYKQNHWDSSLSQSARFEAPLIVDTRCNTFPPVKNQLG